MKILYQYKTQANYTKIWNIVYCVHYYELYVSVQLQRTFQMMFAETQSFVWDCFWIQAFDYKMTIKNAGLIALSKCLVKNKWI